MTFGPQNMRDIADKVQNLIKEAEKTGQETPPADAQKSLDHLLTVPASAQKIASQIVKQFLIFSKNFDCWFLPIIFVDSLLWIGSILSPYHHEENNLRSCGVDSFYSCTRPKNEQRHLSN